MTKEERLIFCKNCKNRELNKELDIICGVTQKIPDFEVNCENFVQEKGNPSQNVIEETSYFTLDELEDNVITKLRDQQDIVFALVGGAAAAIVGAILWALVTVSTKYQIGYMAIGVGALAGFSVRYYGSGIDKIFGVIGILFALFGCAIGNLLSQLAFIAEAEKMTYLDVISLLNLTLTKKIFAEGFAPLDIVFYGIAGYEGYRFAFRKISSEDVKTISSDQPTTLPFSKFKIPTVVALFVLISLGAVGLYKNSSSTHTFNYESGAKHYQGASENGLENGQWIYWWENGQVQQKGYFKSGKQDGVWEFYNEEGVLYRRSSYKLDNQHGSYQEFYPNGKVSVTGKYDNGRQSELWEYYYQDGNLSQRGYYYLDQPDSIWEIFFSNGKLRSKGKFYRGEQRGVWTHYFEDGSLSAQMDYGGNGKLLIKNMWMENGIQTVKDGNGKYTSYYPKGDNYETGTISKGQRFGLWKIFGTQRRLLEEGEFKDQRYYLVNSWSFDGKPMVVNGNGNYANYYNDSTGAIKEEGKILKGIRTREWKISSVNKSMIQKSNYVNGLLEGKFQTFFETGEVSAEGSFIEDRRSGNWTWYYQNGSVESIVSFVNGKKDGTQMFFDSEDKLIRTEFYQDGELRKVTLGQN